MPPLALVGNLSRDVVDGGPPRIGGAPYYAARAWRVLGTRGTIFTRSGPEDRRAYVRHVTALGLPVVSLEGTATTSFSFHYEGDTRIMTVVQPGDVWTPADAEVVPPGGWIHVAPLLRSDFPAETLGALARGRHLSLDGQGLVRASEPGPLRLDADFDPAMLEHVQILKLAEEEAEVVGAIDKLGVPEVLVTFGERGSRVYYKGRSEEVGAWPVAVDPTGSGDAFSAAYLAGRSQGMAPVAAARQATGVVGALLTGRLT
ncbi:MAG TPA: PfkB family carbohydrate kinase [Gaiellaceae bacterium]